MRIENLDRVQSFVTLDGSTIRELAGPASGNAENQSLAEAAVPVGGATAEHYHRTTEEIYLFTHGSGRMRLGASSQALEHRLRAAPPSVRVRARLHRRGHRAHGVIALYYTF